MGIFTFRGNLAWKLCEKYLTEPELQKAIVRNDTVSKLYEKLYEDNATGKVSDEWFTQLSRKYEVERLELKSKISELRKKGLTRLVKAQKEREDFIYVVRQFMQMNSLTAPLLRELIDHVDIFETEDTGKSRTQRIAIYCRFVGHAEIPDALRKPHKTKEQASYLL